MTREAVLVDPALAEALERLLDARGHLYCAFVVKPVRTLPTYASPLPLRAASRRLPILPSAAGNGEPRIRKVSDWAHLILSPVAAASGSIRRVAALCDYLFRPELAGQLQETPPLYRLRQHPATLFERQAAQVAPVEVQQIEGV